MPLTIIEKQELKKFITKNNLTINVKDEWSNFCQTVSIKTMLLDVQDEASLSTIMEYLDKLNAEKAKKNSGVIVRSVAGGNDDENSQSFSITPLGDGDVVIRLVGDNFRQVTVMDFEKHLINAGSNLRIIELQKKLEKKEIQFSTRTNILLPHATVGGAGPCYDTGSNNTAFASDIESYRMMLENGKIIYISEDELKELVDGKFKDIDIPQEQIKQWFHIIRAGHFNLFGIILNANIKCKDQVKLKRTCDVRTYSQYQEEIGQGYYVKKHARASAIGAFAVKEDPERPGKWIEDTDCKSWSLQYWEEEDKNTKSEGCHPREENAIQKTEIAIEEAMDFVAIVNKWPELMPYYNKYCNIPLAIGLQDTVEIGLASDVGHPQRYFPHDIRDLNILVQVDHPTNFESTSDYSSQIKEINEGVYAICRDFAEKNQFPLSNIYNRYLNGTPDGMSITSHEPGKRVYALDFILFPIPGCDEMIAKFCEFFTQLANRKENPLKIKYHLHKFMPKDFDPQEIHGQGYKDFITARDEFYACKAFGLNQQHSMFVNDFTCTALKLNPTPGVEAKRQLENQTSYLPTKWLFANSASQNPDNRPQLIKRIEAFLNRHSESNTMTDFKEKLEHIVQAYKVEVIQKPPQPSYSCSVM